MINFNGNINKHSRTEQRSTPDKTGPWRKSATNVVSRQQANHQLHSVLCQLPAQPDLVVKLCLPLKNAHQIFVSI